MIDYLAVISTESAALADAVHGHEATRVPACPDWSGTDLLLHLAGVQQFWAYVTGLHGAAPNSSMRPRLDADADPFATATRMTRDLLFAFQSVDLSAPTWVWWNEAESDTVAASMRRQAHEALIHRVDAEQTAGLPSSVAPVLAADGVSEFVERMLTDPVWTTWPAEPGLIELHATDTDDHWYVRADDTGLTLDLEPTGRPIATIAAVATDLDLALWRRIGWADLWFAGDLDAIEAFLGSADLT